MFLSPIRAAHPVANRGASGAVFWKDAWHLAPSPWLLAVGWHRNVSFPYIFLPQTEREALEKSFNYLRPAGAAVRGLIFTNCGERYKTTLSMQTCLRVFFLFFFFFIWSTLWGSVLTFVFPLTGNPSQTWLRSLARHSEWPALRYSEWALQDGDA